MRKASKIGAIVLLSLMLVGITAVAYAQTQVSVYIRNPLTNSNDAEGTVSGSCLMGGIPITTIGGDVEV